MLTWRQNSYPGWGGRSSWFQIVWTSTAWGSLTLAFAGLIFSGGWEMSWGGGESSKNSVLADSKLDLWGDPKKDWGCRVRKAVLGLEGTRKSPSPL